MWRNGRNTQIYCMRTLRVEKVKEAERGLRVLLSVSERWILVCMCRMIDERLLDCGVPLVRVAVAGKAELP